MILDGFALQGLLQELRPLCIGGRIDKITQPGSREIQMTLRKDGTNTRLSLLADPAHPALTCSLSSQPSPKQAPHFCMVLRKYLLGARLLRIEAPNWERIVFFTVEHRDELGDLRQKTLVLELLGRQSNLLLLQEDNRIVDSLVHVDESMSKSRCLLPARPYIPPLRPERLQPDELLEQLRDPIAWRSKRLTETAEAPLEDWFLHSIFGVSPWLAKAWAEVCCESADTRCLNIKQSGVQTLQNSLEALIAKEYRPTLYRNSGGKPCQLHVLQYKLPTNFAEPIPSLLQAYSEDQDRARKQQRLQAQQAGYLQPLRTRIRQLTKKEQLLLKDQEESSHAEEYRIRGELLLSHLHLIHPGMHEVQVTDYYAETPNTLLTISLDPALSPSQLAQKQFKLYNKYKTRLETATNFYKETHEERLYCERLAQLIETASDPEDWVAIEEEWERLALHPKSAKDKRTVPQSLRALLNPGKPGRKKSRPGQASQRQPKERESTALPPRTFTLPSGHILEVGRNNLQNDRLTLKAARKTDLWFHRKGVPGPHAILHLPTPIEVSEEDCSLAASICAWFSLSATQRAHLEQNGGVGEKMEIDCCPVAQVWKPKGARPGRVEYRGQTTYPVLARDPESVTESLPVQPPASEQNHSL